MGNRNRGSANLILPDVAATAKPFPDRECFVVWKGLSATTDAAAAVNRPTERPLERDGMKWSVDPTDGCCVHSVLPSFAASV